MFERVKSPEQVRRELTARMSLRVPQEKSLDILADVVEQLKLAKDGDTDGALKGIQKIYQTVKDFERDFPSLCFALATGVGKTRLLGAFIAYLYLSEKSRNFFLLAPNTTIYHKLVADLTPGTRKYVFKGVAAFAQNQPVVVTGDTWDQSTIFVDAARRNGGVVINIFNIDKINKDAGRIKKLNEYVGDSYFNFLASLPDLILIMDEAHRYRAKAAMKAVTDLKPVLGLELTATPKSVGFKSVDFKNVIYRFGLGEAMQHGYVKEPAVATRKDFDPKSVSSDERLDEIKLEDGIHAHEHVRLELEKFATETGKPQVRPFMLVVAQHTDHARKIREVIQSDRFFGGYYRERVIQVDSTTKSKEESDEITERLLKLETEGTTEIVIHVNMLKEGWDVTNLFTIVPLRASASDILTEQTLGRGLRLPYGERTGVEAIDRLTVIAHDRFDDVIKAAREPDSIVSMKAVTIGDGGDIPQTKSILVEAKSKIEVMLTGEAGRSGEGQQGVPVFKTPEERTVAKVTLDVIQRMERQFTSLNDLHKPEVQAKIVEQVKEMTKTTQGTLDLKMNAALNVDAVVATVAQQVTAGTIEIPEIVVLPDSSVSYTFRDFDLQRLDEIGVRPMSDEITLQELRTERRSFIRRSIGASIKQERLEDYLVSELFAFDEIDYDAHAELLYKLTGQMVARLRQYLPDDDAVENALAQHATTLAEFIFGQMMQHYDETPTSYRVRVERGFQSLKKQNLSNPTGRPFQDFRTPVKPLADTRRYTFTGFKKCCYLQQAFQSNDERRFAVLIDSDHEKDVLRWVKPGRNQFVIDYRRGERYEPDFVVETTTEKFICEIKARNEFDDPTVQAKAKAARTWVSYANEHARSNGGKPWRYVLIPGDTVTENASLTGLVARFELPAIRGFGIAA
jgi:type III restriction enzyme